MENNTYSTLKEIRSQTHSWAEALDLLVTQSPGIGMLKPSNYHQILFIGCGSTYYLSLSAAAQMQICTNTISRGIPSSELLFYPYNYIVPGSGRTLLIAISRSGTTTETLLAVEKFKRSNSGDLITITNYKDSPLSQLGDINLSIPSGREESIAQTRSFSSMFVMATALTALMGNEWEHLSKNGRADGIG
jgi:glutamine---fructose-6-phosphate transaminase (isomerizing)